METGLNSQSTLSRASALVDANPDTLARHWTLRPLSARVGRHSLVHRSLWYSISRRPRLPVTLARERNRKLVVTSRRSKATVMVGGGKPPTTRQRMTVGVWSVDWITDLAETSSPNSSVNLTLITGAMRIQTSSSSSSSSSSMWLLTPTASNTIKIKSNKIHRFAKAPHHRSSGAPTTLNGHKNVM